MIRTHVPLVVGPFFIGVTLAALTGCAGGDAKVELTSLKDPYFPEQMTVRLENARYWRGPDRDVHIVARGETAGKADESPIRQYLYVRSIWNVNPGRTTTDSTALNAVIRYVVATSTGTVEYRGHGFLYFAGRPDETLEFAVESASLSLEATTGDVPEIVSPARLVAQIKAPRDDNGVARWLREMERLTERGVDTASR